MLRALRWALLWALLILVLCLMPGAVLPSWRWADLFSIDKLVHAGLFAVLFVLLAHGVAKHRSGLGLREVRALLIVCIAYGGALELMQTMPDLGRRGDLNDLLANTVGVLLGWVGYRWSRNRERRSAEPGDA